MSQNSTRDFKLRLQAGERIFGHLVGPGGKPHDTLKKLKDMGDYFIVLDLEHSLINSETIYEYVKAASKMDMTLLVRPQDKAAYFRCYLDAGINGMMLPLVNRVEEAAHAVDMSYFPPLGHRGHGIGVNPYLINFQNLDEVPWLTLARYINDNTVIFPQTETLESISNLRRILSLDGVTGTIVGSFDLVFNIGSADSKDLISDVVQSKVIKERMKEILRICKESGKVAGTGSPVPEDLAYWANEGYKLLLMGYVMDGNVEAHRTYHDIVMSLIK